MPSRITPDQRQSVLSMLAHGLDRYTIAAQVGVTPGQVSAITAHVKMGTYVLPAVASARKTQSTSSATERSSNLLPPPGRHFVKPTRIPVPAVKLVFVGTDADSGEEVFWNPDPTTGAVNPHLLVLGESGAGKTYAILGLLAELARQGVVAIVFDYGQGFSLDAVPPEFREAASPVEIQASRDGIAINPLTIFASDVHGPTTVAQRIADTFARVYNKIGVQQHAVLRQAVLNAFAGVGIVSTDPSSWHRPEPPFAHVRDALDALAAGTSGAANRLAATVASHISTVFIFNTFRPSGQGVSWHDMLTSSGQVFILQLKGLEHSLERVVTEFLLWNLIGFAETLGPGPLRTFVVLDEAHRLAFTKATPAETLLREGRKFGLGLILASQQPEDFSPVAFANTATKLVFQVADDNYVVSRRLHRKVSRSETLLGLASIITTLPRGECYMITENRGLVVRIASFANRNHRWGTPTDPSRE